MTTYECQWLYRKKSLHNILQQLTGFWAWLPEELPCPAFLDASLDELFELLLLLLLLELLALAARRRLAMRELFLPIPIHFSRWGANLEAANVRLHFGHSHSKLYFLVNAFPNISTPGVSTIWYSSGAVCKIPKTSSSPHRRSLPISFPILKYSSSIYISSSCSHAILSVSCKIKIYKQIKYANWLIKWSSCRFKKRDYKLIFFKRFSTNTYN